MYQVLNDYDFRLKYNGLHWNLSGSGRGSASRKADSCDTVRGAGHGRRQLRKERSSAPKAVAMTTCSTGQEEDMVVGIAPCLEERNASDLAVEVSELYLFHESFEPQFLNEEVVTVEETLRHVLKQWKTSKKECHA